ncbi:MAG: hypothetical protein DRO23_02860 [Thermoprotei archaeon]|nr:MAG: hypothetical protein DRO23_02860 [Thermoprotei archaeon]
MLNDYLNLLKVYNNIETTIRTHSKRIRTLRKLIKAYVEEQEELLFKKIITTLEQLRYDRKIIEKNLNILGEIASKTSSFADNTKDALDVLDYTHALLDYLSIVDLKNEYKLLRVLLKISKNNPQLEQYTEVFKHDLKDVRQLKSFLENVLENVKNLIKNLIRHVDDEEFIEKYLKDLSFSPKNL